MQQLNAGDVAAARRTGLLRVEHLRQLGTPEERKLLDDNPRLREIMAKREADAVMVRQLRAWQASIVRYWPPTEKGNP